MPEKTHFTGDGGTAVRQINGSIGAEKTNSPGDANTSGGDKTLAGLILPATPNAYLIPHDTDCLPPANGTSQPTCSLTLFLPLPHMLRSLLAINIEPISGRLLP